MDKEKLEIKLYYDTVGIIPPGFDSSHPPIDMPKDVIVPFSEKLLIYFWQNRKKHQAIVSQRMQSEYGRVVWEDTCDTSMKIMCTLTPETDGYIARARKWKETIINKVNEILQEYSEFSIRPLQESMKQFLNQVGDIQQQNTDNVMLNLEDTSGVITIVGVNHESQNLHKQFGDIYQSVIDDMNKQKRVITEQMNSLSPIQLKLIVKADLVSTLNARYKEFNMYIETDILYLKGIPATISEAKIAIKTFVTEINKRHHPLSSMMKTLISSGKVQEYVSDHIDKHVQETVILEFTSSDIVIYGRRVDTFDKILDELQRILVEENRQCDSEDMDLLISKMWLKELQYKCSEFIDFFKADAVNMNNGGVFTVAATENVIDKVRKLLNDFLDDNRKSERFIKMEIGKLKCLEQHFQADVLKGIIDIGINIKLIPSFDMKNPGYSLVGTKENVCQVVQILQTVSSRIHKHEKVIQKMSIGKILTEDNGKIQLAGIESKNKVSIEIKSTDFKDIDENTSYTKIVRNTPIVVIQGDILKVQADVLVNAANVHLSHGGGLAKSMSDAGKLYIKQIEIFGLAHQLQKY